MKRKIQLKGKRRYGKLPIYLVSFLMGILVFVVLLHTEKKALSDYETRTAAVAKCNIAAGTCIGKSELENFLEFEEVNVAYAVSDLTSLKQAEDWIEDDGSIIACVDIKEKEQVYKEKFVSMKSECTTMSHPVETGIKVESYEYSVGGKLRAGDFVDVSVVNVENEGETILENVLILKAFDISGNEIMPEDKNAVSVGFNILVEKEELELCQPEIENGILRLTKKF